MTAALPLVLGAPRSFAGLFVFVVAAGGILLSSVEAGAVAAITAAAVGIGLAATGSDGSTVAAYTLTVVVVGTIMITLGAMVRANRDLRAAREELARAAVSEERLRIARDLHDLLGHTLSLITLKSQLAAKLVETDASRARVELEDVQKITREALAEVREAVHTYRLRSVAEAIEGAPHPGRRGSTAASTPRPTSSLRRSSVLAWAVREASTNVVRHSGAHVCAITLVRGAAGVSLQIDDDGSGAGGSATGSGLAGLADRAAAARTLEAGAGPGGLPSAPQPTPASDVIRVLIAEDQALVRGALAVCSDSKTTSKWLPRSRVATRSSTRSVPRMWTSRSSTSRCRGATGSRWRRRSLESCRRHER